MGLAIVPVAAGIGLVSMIAYPRLVRRVPGRTLLIGLAVLAGGLALLTRLPIDGR